MLRRLALLTFTLAACSVALASPAGAESDIAPAALPTGCTSRLVDESSIAHCTSHNGGSYRAFVVCRDSSTGNVHRNTGPWRQTGNSVASCGSHTAVSGGIETSADDRTISVNIA